MIVRCEHGVDVECVSDVGFNIVETGDGRSSRGETCPWWALMALNRWDLSK